MTFLRREKILAHDSDAICWVQDGYIRLIGAMLWCEIVIRDIEICTRKWKARRASGISFEISWRPRRSLMTSSCCWAWHRLISTMMKCWWICLINARHPVLICPRLRPSRHSQHRRSCRTQFSLRPESLHTRTNRRREIPNRRCY